MFAFVVSPPPAPTMSVQTLELLIIAYGSRDTESIGDDRYGVDQRQFEIALRPNCREPAGDLRVGQFVVHAPVPERQAQVRRLWA
jgi:hypothetical protein